MEICCFADYSTGTARKGHSAIPKKPNQPKPPNQGTKKTQLFYSAQNPFEILKIPALAAQSL